MNHFVQELLRIVGNEDGTGGEFGTTEVSGFLARCIVLELGAHPHSLLHGVTWDHPVRVSRAGHLELWVNGFYTEGKGVRKIVHNAIRRYEQELPNQREAGFPRHGIH
jgi:hypothetical protein